MKLTIASGLAFFGFLIGPSAQDTPLDIAKLEQAVLQSRRAFVRGQVELESVYWSTAGKAELKNTRTETIWFDGDDTRSDRQYLEGNNKGRSSKRSFSNGKVINWEIHFPKDKLANPAAGQAGVVIRDQEDVDKQKPSYLTIIRPQEIGLFPTSAANSVQQRAEELFKRTDRSDLKIQQEKLGTKECWLVSYVIKPQGQPVNVRYWIAPKLGNAVMRIEIEGQPGKERYLDSIESDVTEVQPGVWFPAKCIYRRHIGDQLVTEEVLKVKVVNYNKPPDRSVFTLQGMNIPPGTSVGIVSKKDNRAGLALVWDGKDIVMDIGPKKK